MIFKTEQELFWTGGFVDAYVARSTGQQLMAYNLNFFARAMRQAHQSIQRD